MALFSLSLKNFVTFILANKKTSSLILKAAQFSLLYFSVVLKKSVIKFVTRNTFLCYSLKNVFELSWFLKVFIFSFLFYIRRVCENGIREKRIFFDKDTFDYSKKRFLRAFACAILKNQLSSFWSKAIQELLFFLCC